MKSSMKTWSRLISQSSLYLVVAFVLASTTVLASDSQKTRALSPAERSAAQQIVDNQWTNLTEDFSEKDNLVIEAIKAKHPNWMITNAKLLAQQFRQDSDELNLTYGNKPILILATINSVEVNKANNEAALNLNAGQGQPSIKALSESEEDNKYMLSREPGWFEILLCRLDIAGRSLELQKCSPQGTVLTEAIDDADETILEALKGKGKTLASLQAAVTAFEVAKAFPKGPLSFEEGKQYAEAVKKIANSISFKVDPKGFEESAKKLGYSEKDIVELLSTKNANPKILQ